MPVAMLERSKIQVHEVFKVTQISGKQRTNAVAGPDTFINIKQLTASEDARSDTAFLIGMFDCRKRLGDDLVGEIVERLRKVRSRDGSRFPSCHKTRVEDGAAQGTAVSGDLCLAECMLRRYQIDVLDEIVIFQIEAAAVVVGRKFPEGLDILWLQHVAPRSACLRSGNIACASHEDVTHVDAAIEIDYVLGLDGGREDAVHGAFGTRVHVVVDGQVTTRRSARISAACIPAKSRPRRIPRLVRG